MCGIVSILSKKRNGFTNNNLDFFDNLLYLDALRGQDSTGVFCVSNIGNVTLAKSDQHSADYIQEKAYRDLKMHAIQKGWALVGHNRKATRGNISDENAHPFWVEEKLVLVHNGTVFGDHKGLADTEVDSHAIAHTLADTEDVEVALRKVNAAYALIWYDIQKKKLNIIRNSQRPLSWAETDDMYVFASEGGMIEYVADRLHTRLLNPAEEIEPHVLDTWTLKEDKSTIYANQKLDAVYRHPVTWQAPSKSPYEWPVVDNDTGEIIEDVPLLEGPRVLSKEEVTMMQSRNKSVLEKVMAQPARDKLYTYLEFQAFKNAFTAMKVKVDVSGYLDVERDVPGSIMMTGVLQEQPNPLFCVFPIHRNMFDAITSPATPKSTKVLFHTEIDSVSWHVCASDRDNAKMNTIDKRGTIVLVGKTGKPHVVTETLH